MSSGRAARRPLLPCAASSLLQSISRSRLDKLITGGVEVAGAAMLQGQQQESWLARAQGQLPLIERPLDGERRGNNGCIASMSMQRQIGGRAREVAFNTHRDARQRVAHGGADAPRAADAAERILVQ